MICTTDNYTYVLFKTNIITEDYMAQTYGIKIIGENEFAMFEDISRDYDSVLKLFHLIIEGELSPVHLKDVIEDFLVKKL